MGKTEDSFSIEDFEKGLMLLGLVSPRTIEEEEEREELELYEKSLRKDSSQTYIKRAVLAAEIVTQLREEMTFGRIKFQKLMYLCEHVAEMKLADRYAKQAAGPFDNKFMHSINAEFKKQKWFDVVNVVDGKYNVPKYIPMENSHSYKQYYSNYFLKHDEHIQFVIELFRKRKTEETELAATVFACVLELGEERDSIKLTELFDVFYNWHDKKKRFTEEQIINSLMWLIDQALLPEITIE